MYTKLDDTAWELFPKDSMTKSKQFFVFYKVCFPYSEYYEKAKILLRRNKINKVKSKIYEIEIKRYN
jgi:hypothetical protein